MLKWKDSGERVRDILQCEEMLQSLNILYFFNVKTEDF